MAIPYRESFLIALSTAVVVPLFSGPLTRTIVVFAILILVFTTRRSRISSTQAGPTAEIDSVPEPTMLSKSLASALPGSILFPRDDIAFKRSNGSHWALQECQVVPACILQPHDDQQLCTAISILKHEYDERKKQTSVEGLKVKGLFAVRGGGHSPLPGSASIKDGILIDLGLLCQVTLSQDKSSVTIGGGAKWKDVSRVLDKEGLAVVGGRNSDVGVGGLTLGGGLSFFTPRFGLVCSNILSYRVVLASGSVVIASATTNPNLWRALKGGSNNFGIVTAFTARCFPCTNIWSGFLYLHASQSEKVLSAFHESVKRADSRHPDAKPDDFAAGPLACFTYIRPFHIQAISVNLVYTKPPETKNKWPAYWKTSPFASMWRFWSTCKLRTLTSATDELASLNTPGKRQILVATTIENDFATIAAAHAAFSRAITTFRGSKVKSLSWTLVLQPFLPEWVRKGDANPLGLDEGTDRPLVNVSFTVNWPNVIDDEFMKFTTRHAVEQIEAFAAANNTGHRYRYINYCTEWQRPFESYGEKNWRFLRQVSREYDPEGLFQRGCLGGFKLDALDDINEAKATPPTRH